MSLDAEAAAPPAGRLYDVQRGLAYDKPSWRGWMHLVAFGCAMVTGTILVLAQHRGWLRADAAVYGGAVAGLFGASALYHRGRWSQTAGARLQRLDHIMIVVLIAVSATPPMQVCLSGVWRTIGLVGLWSFALTTILIRSCWMNAPERLVGGLYIGLGWAAGAAIPAVWMHAGVTPGLLLLGGGLLYTAGAIGYHRRRPDPLPAVFGYHEVFHTYVTLAAACQYVAIAVYLL